jgi:shikimate kinase
MCADKFERIYLIGYMGSGKSTLGKRLANRMNYGFLDTDQVFEEKYACTIYDFFLTHGEAEFRKLEHKILRDTLKISGVIISTGGGTPCHYNNMELINQHGFSIYLQMPADALHQRLKRTRRVRPLTIGKNEAELADYIKTNLREREEYYKQASLSVSSLNLKARDLETMIQYYRHQKSY